MMEKLKDIFYDLNDLLVTLIIILVIVLAIAYVFTNAFDLDLNRASVFDFFTGGEDTPPVTPQSPTETTVPEPETKEVETPSGGIISVDPESDEPQTNEANQPTEPPATSVVVTLPPGGTLAGFAQEMQQKGVIKDYESFINIVSSQGLDTQVQAGDYTFPLDITDAEAVRIMFGN